MGESARVYPLRRDPVPGPQPQQPPPPELPPQEPLWREVLGQRLRALRLGQLETLAETAGRAGISPQYLSEIERGRKEPSSEMIAALAGALGISLVGLTEQVAGELRRQGGAAGASASSHLLLSLAA
jgi:DNA-binding XRE family transcriptional regulator